MDEDRKQARTEISKELRTLGQRLREAFAAARDSQQAQEFQQELSRCLSDLRAEIGDLLETDEVQRIEETVRGAVLDRGAGDVGQQIRKGVLAALKEFNTRIDSIIKEAEKAEVAAGTSSEEAST